MVDLRSEGTLYSLSSRITGTESLLFLESVLRSVKSKLEKLVAPNKKSLILDFYSNTVESIPELRMFVYRCVSKKFIDV